jgi:DNA polymerase/3'-5' exonuclease PolX
MAAILTNRRPLAEAQAIAGGIVEMLAPLCERIEIAGSVRRRRESVKDVEIVYVSKVELLHVDGQLFAEEVLAADARIYDLERAGVLAMRPNVNGAFTFGSFNKLMIHAQSGLAVDLFRTTEAAWWSYLVCRTGGAESNTLLASSAQRVGLSWHPYAGGFSRVGEPAEKCVHWPTSEAEVFRLAGRPWLEPEARP